MLLREQLSADMKEAMKAREAGKLRLAVIRMVWSTIRNLEIDKKKELTEEEIAGVIAKEVKMRKDSIEEFKKGDRTDLVEQAEMEVAILLPYLPQQMSEEEVRQVVADTIAEIGATSPKEMGKVMSALMPKVKGRADGKLVNTIVRELLNQ